MVISSSWLLVYFFIGGVYVCVHACACARTRTRTHACVLVDMFIAKFLGLLPGACECMPMDKLGSTILRYSLYVLSFKCLFTFVYLSIWTSLCQFLY